MGARLDFGCVWINCHIPLAAKMPHGGFKHSGYGKDLSMYGLEDYTRIKHVMSTTDSRTDLSSSVGRCAYDDHRPVKPRRCLLLPG
jgi:Aldehyde dehydrogenase family